LIFRIIGNVGLRTVLLTVVAVGIFLVRGTDVFEGILPEGFSGSSGATDEAEPEASGEAASWLERILASEANPESGAKFESADKSGSAPPGGAALHLLDTPDGLRADGSIAAMPGNRPVFIDDVVSDYATRVSDDIPSEITTIRPISGCRLTAPEADTEVGHITAGRSKLELALSTYNDGHLAAAVQTLVNAVRSGSKAVASDIRGPAYEAYDVAVTETRAPVYLVLENSHGNRIWNIHLAPGARIERVVLLGGDHAGVANLDPVVPVEVLLGEALAACGIQPAYRLNSGHLFFQSMNSGAMSKTEAETKLATINDAVAAYDTWFRDTFGVLAEESRAGFDEGTISVVGPVPGEAAPKAVYAPMRGARVRMTQDIFFEIQGQVAKGEDFASRVTAIATAFAFGDLNNLKQGVEF
jgi:hypothetical protein